MSFFEEILLWAVRHNSLRFDLIWITITAAAGIWVASAVGQAAALASQKGTRRREKLHWEPTQSLVAGHEATYRWIERQVSKNAPHGLRTQVQEL